MNKLTKIGLTALAGSLATVAGAQAGAMTVSGGSNVFLDKYNRKYNSQYSNSNW